MRHGELLLGVVIGLALGFFVVGRLRRRRERLPCRPCLGGSPLGRPCPPCPPPLPKDLDIKR